ncbi:unnamed protein product [Mycena citricolor]|uniref:Uncharacterized protein n=1 Tax=Mycena citricolor TaxID=2018698 RepID=A0AAD2GXL5_9AGAR|nr:unnamed protein product [Mycena citricolor]CAK5264440.1 unnamed protein product [Mycena citricolor]
MTIPTGVVNANSSTKAIANQSRPPVLEAGSDAIRIPRERPSNNWWKMIAVSREAMSSFGSTQLGERGGTHTEIATGSEGQGYIPEENERAHNNSNQLPSSADFVVLFPGLWIRFEVLGGIREHFSVMVRGSHADTEHPPVMSAQRAVSGWRK